MTKEFVTYKQAVALKELGFDEPCIGFHSKIYGLLLISSPTNKVNEVTGEVLAPLKSQVYRWFREKHGLYVEVFVDDNKTFGFMISYFIGKDYSDERVDKPIQRGYETYEEAENDCIDKLIEIIKNK